MKKKTGIIIGIIVIILLGVFIAYKIINNPKNIFLKGMNEVINSLEEDYDNLLNNKITKLSSDNSIVNDISINTKININDEFIDENTSEIIDEINNFSTNMKIGTDIKKKEIFYYLNILSGTDETFNFELMGKDKILYIGIKQLFEKYINIPVNDYDMLFENENIKDLTYIKDILKKSILNSFDEKDFKKTSENIYVDETKISANKINYEVTEKNLYKIALKILKDMSNDSKTLEILEKYSEVKKDDLKDQINELIDSLNDEYDDLSTDKIFDINIYSKGLDNKIVRYELSTKSDYSSNNISISKLDNKTVIIFNEDEEELLKSVTTTDKDKSNTVITIDDIKITINGSGTDEKIYKYEVSEIEQIKISGQIKIINKEITKDKEYKNEFSFNINVKQNNNEIADFTLNVLGSTYIGKDLEINIPSNSIEYTEITEEDLNKIINNLKNLPLINSFTSTMINE